MKSNITKILLSTISVIILCSCSDSDSDYSRIDELEYDLSALQAKFGELLQAEKAAEKLEVKVGDSRKQVRSVAGSPSSIAATTWSFCFSYNAFGDIFFGENKTVTRISKGFNEKLLKRNLENITPQKESLEKEIRKSKQRIIAAEKYASKQRAKGRVFYNNRWMSKGQWTQKIEREKAKEELLGKRARSTFHPAAHPIPPLPENGNTMP